MRGCYQGYTNGLCVVKAASSIASTRNLRPFSYKDPRPTITSGQNGSDNCEGWAKPSQGVPHGSRLTGLVPSRPARRLACRPTEAMCGERSPTQAADMVKRRRGAIRYYFAHKMTVELGPFQFLFMCTGHGCEPQTKWSLEGNDFWAPEAALVGMVCRRAAVGRWRSLTLPPTHFPPSTWNRVGGLGEVTVVGAHV